MNLWQDIKSGIAWLQSKLIPAGANSWLVEGAVSVPATAVSFHFLGPVFGLVAFTLVSVAYEKYLDPRGWSIDDVAQRGAWSLLVGYITLLF